MRMHVIVGWWGGGVTFAWNLERLSNVVDRHASGEMCSILKRSVSISTEA